jgi:hypothetical protein
MSTLWGWAWSRLVLPSLTLPRGPDGTQGQGQGDVFRPVRHDGSQAGCVADGVGPPAAASHHMAANRKLCILALDHPGEESPNQSWYTIKVHMFVMAAGWDIISASDYSIEKQIPW